MIAAMAALSAGGVTGSDRGIERCGHHRLGNPCSANARSMHSTGERLFVNRSYEQVFVRTGVRCYCDPNTSSAVGGLPRRSRGGPMAENTLTDRQRGILECIDQSMQDRGYPPSVRE